MSPRHPQPPRPVLREGTIANPDPDALTVLIDGFDGDRQVREEWGPCELSPRGHLLPARGDRCVVVTTDYRRLVVVWWDGGTPAEPAIAGTPRWTTPTFRANYADFGGANAVGHWRDPLGTVFLRGFVSRTGSTWSFDEILFTLPAALWPQQNVVSLNYATGNNVAGSARIDVLAADGTVRYRGGAPTWGGATNLLALDNVRYPTAVE